MLEQRAEALRADAAGGEEPVLLALVDLAREQASELARQNDELRRQNEALARANRHQAEFLTTMSHELRTPLNAILGFSELLTEEIAGPLTAAQAEYLSDIRRAGTNLLSLINDLLDMAKIDAGRLEVRRELIDLAVPVSRAAETVRAMALRKAQRLEVRADGAVACFADVRRVQQVALNLLGNAVKFTPRGGSVVATVAREEGGVLLAVADTGIGIDPAHHESIFEAFRQIDGGETREYPGTGLGLALVARFTGAMGGTVHVASEPGRGSTFTVRLPAPARAAGPVLAFLGRGKDTERLRALAEELGFECDDLGPPDAFAVRPGTAAVVVAAEARDAAGQARELAPEAEILDDEGAPDVLAGRLRALAQRAGRMAR